jgi:hypothetical protein
MGNYVHASAYKLA